MSLTHREIWTAVHGMILGAGFLILFAGAFAGLWMLKSNWLTENGARKCARYTATATWAMALLAFAAVFLGTYVIYPWYRAVPPEGTSASALAGYPKALLRSNPQAIQWHTFGMEWKEHLAWMTPMLATAVAFSLSRMKGELAIHPRVRGALLALLTVAFFCAAVAGALGALINKAAPTR